MIGPQLGDHIAEKFNIKLSRAKTYRVRSLALHSMDGNHDEQFARLWDYREELLRTNPGTTFEILAPGVPSRFDRLYICIDACKKGFLAGCRPLIAIDGCFLKGYYRGQVLSDVAQDGSNCLFLIAYAVVSSETRETWSWFLVNLLRDIGLTSPRGERWTFISDQGTGLVSALEDVYPSKYHRLCVLHLFRNFKKRWRGKQVESQFWKAVNATTIEDYNVHMNEMQQTCGEAWKHLTDIGMERWSKAGFEAHVNSSAISSNIVECFNGKILEFRGGGVTSLIENIRAQAMTRMYENGEKMRKQSCELCPNIIEKLNISIVDSRVWDTAPCGDWQRAIFEVSHRPEKFVVNLDKHTCTCRKWDISGIPCKHAVAAIEKINKKHEDFVSEYFTRERLLKTYEHCIFPLTGPHFWPKSDRELILPPLYRRSAGRPKKRRAKDPAESKDRHKAKRKYRPTKCGKCGGLGHNKRSCKNKNDEQDGLSRNAVPHPEYTTDME